MSSFPVEITDVAPSRYPEIWLGVAKLPGTRFANKIMIFRVEQEFIAISALCPHQGYDLSEQKLCDGKIVCPLHGLEIDVLSTSQKGYTVERKGSEFVITGLRA